MRREPDRLVEQWLVLDDAAGLEPAASRQDHLRLGVVDAGRELVRGEAAEHHRVHRANARAGEHGDHRLRHHRHIDHHTVALGDAELAQNRSQHLGLDLECVIGERALLASQRRIVNDRRLFAAALHYMAVDRVPARIADTADEPAPVDAGIGIEHLLRRLDPVDLLRGFTPKTLRVVLAAGIDLVVAAPSGIHGSVSARIIAPSILRSAPTRPVLVWRHFRRWEPLTKFQPYARRDLLDFIKVHCKF